MRKVVLAVLIFVGAVALYASYPPSLVTPPRPRFEAIYWEGAQNKNMIAAFEVWHDKESGQEFICARSYYNGLGTAQVPISCWPTGRTW
jgi:hypothetical protein